MTRKLTAAEVAEHFGVTLKTVTGWITAGELLAVDASRRRGSKKPRWRIDPENIQAFERGRTTTPPATPPERRKRQSVEGVIQFFK